MSDVRVRFAPSPTGYLHLGGVRTALFNWLWARQQGGVFVLRVEDTDLERNTQDSVRGILTSMRWLGLDWDEGPEAGGGRGPYYQSERLAMYRDYAERLIEAGAAYRCYCTKEDLERARAEHEASGSKEPFRYPGTCRERTDQPDKPFVVRFKSPRDGETGWDDLVKGRIDMPNAQMHDFVLLRSNGLPLFAFGGVVDDLTMEITLVARGDDHMINTPQQILMMRALGAEPPRYAHLPMILAPNGEKLSKRHAAVNVLEYRDLGYLPDAVLNYLARLGWSHGDQEIFSRQELIEKFDWERVGSTAGRYDARKFEHVQASHLRMRAPRELAAWVAPFLKERGLTVGVEDPRLAAAIETVLPRSATLQDVTEAIDFYFRHPIDTDEAARAKFLTPERADKLRALREVVAETTPFEREQLEERVKAWVEATDGLKLKDVAQPARVALTGKTRSPGLFEVMEVLGRDLTLARLDRGAEMAEHQPPQGAVGGDEAKPPGGSREG